MPLFDATAREREREIERERERERRERERRERERLMNADGLSIVTRLTVHGHADFSAGCIHNSNFHR